MMKKLIFTVIILFSLVFALDRYLGKQQTEDSKQAENKQIEAKQPESEPSSKPEPEKNETVATATEIVVASTEKELESPVEDTAPAVRKTGIIFQDVPFIVQAPTGNWGDMREEDGCEETASLMAVKWARGEEATSSKAGLEKEILAIADFETARYGSYVDTSASSTAQRIIEGYFRFSDYEYLENATLTLIIKALEERNVVIVPTNGKALLNPNFKNGGPNEHMVLIKGYDYDKREFITNDPGTRNGNGYRYQADLLFSAIRDYPTGNHLAISGNKKNIIVISKEKSIEYN